MFIQAAPLASNNQTKSLSHPFGKPLTTSEMNKADLYKQQSYDSIKFGEKKFPYLVDSMTLAQIEDILGRNIPSRNKGGLNRIEITRPELNKVITQRPHLNNRIEQQ